jgi:hypothetical protein
MSLQWTFCRTQTNLNGLESTGARRRDTTWRPRFHVFLDIVSLYGEESFFPHICRPDICGTRVIGQKTSLLFWIVLRFSKCCVHIKFLKNYLDDSKSFFISSVLCWIMSWREGTYQLILTYSGCLQLINLSDLQETSRIRGKHPCTGQSMSFGGLGIRV